MTNRMDYIELGLACADVCTVLKRGLNGKTPNDLNNSVYEAINQLTKRVTSAIDALSTSLTVLPTWPRAVAGIERNITKQVKRNVTFRYHHAKNDKDKIAGWKSDLVRILQVFNVRSIISI